MVLNRSTIPMVCPVACMEVLRTIVSLGIQFSDL